MLFKNILVPYDGSSFSKKAFDVALDIAQKYKSKITLVWYVDVFSAGWFGKSKVEVMELKALEADRRKRLSSLESKAKKSGISIKPNLIESTSVARPLISFAKSHKIDLIVIGSHGHSGFDRFFLGSVSNSVMQRARCPVMVVK